MEKCNKATYMKYPHSICWKLNSESNRRFPILFGQNNLDKHVKREIAQTLRILVRQLNYLLLYKD